MATPPIEQGTSSKSDARTFNLAQLDELLLFEGQVRHDLGLKDSQRRLVRQGSLKYKRKEYRVFLLDHVLIVTKPKTVDGRERLRVVDHPIPVQLVRASSDQAPPTILGCIPLPLGKPRYRLRISSLGQRFNSGKDFALFTPTAEESKAWVEAVNAQREANQQSAEPNVLRLGQDVLEGNGEIKVNCAALYDKNCVVAVDRNAEGYADNDPTIVYGTDDGVYFQPQNGRPRKAIDLTGVRQVDVLEDLLLLVVLAERSVFTFPLDALDQFDRMSRMNRIANGQTSFFKAGTCMGRSIVCIVKVTSHSSTVKALEQFESLPEANPNRKLKTVDKATKLKVFKEFNLDTELYSIQFLRTKICAAGATGFEIIDLETLNKQVLLDPSDNALSFVRQHKHPRPLCVYGIGNEFLVCYREFAFYVNKSGWKSDKNVIIYWEGTPTTCALRYPYIAAFSPNFIEIRHVDDGSLIQVIRKKNVRCLYAESSILPTSSGDPSTQVSRRPSNTLVSLNNQVMFLASASH